MSVRPIAIERTGLVTAVGLTAQECCAAFRARIANPTETRFIDSAGTWIMAHQVALESPWRGLTKLAKMAALAIAEALEDVPKSQWARLPLLLCVAERARPGRMAGLDDDLFALIEQELGVRFDERSSIVAEGRISAALSLAHARALMADSPDGRVLIAAVDSLLTWPTLIHYDSEARLLTERNPNGFIPGEGAGAMLVSLAVDHAGLVCTGLGFGVEPAPVDADEPCRAEGLTRAIKSALAEASFEMHDLDFRITDVAGEQYYFKEADLALSRTLRQLKPSFDLWHPAECIGDVGAAMGIAVLALAEAALRKGYAPGRRALAHLGVDAGRRAALTVGLMQP